MSNLKVNICGVEFKNPIIAASGTFGFGMEYNEFYPISRLGGVSCKGTTLHEKHGNPPIRIAETPSGMLNSVGLQNPGVDKVISGDLKWLRSQDVVFIANVAGSAEEDYCETAEKVSAEGVDFVELNISCPNVKAGGVQFGTSCDSVYKIVKAVKARCRVPLMVKLSPNVTDISEISKSAEAAGADAISLINTITGMRIDINSRRPVLRNNVGGLSGPAIFPIALRMVWQAANSVSIPVIGIGGVAKWEDAIEMLLAGASAVQVGAAIFRDPYAPLKIIDGIRGFMEQNNIKSLTEIIGKVEPWKQQD